MVDAITGFVVNKIGDYLLQEAALLYGVKDELEDLKVELACIQGFLKDAEAKQDEDNRLKVWINLVKDIAYDIEDILDSYFLKVENRSDGSSRAFIGTTVEWSCGICAKFNAYNVAKDITWLKKRILDISRMRETYCIRNVNDSPQERLSSRLRQIRRTPSVIEEEHIIGLEDDKKVLLEKLLNERSRSYMISIHGMGGLGKTSLARKLYNSYDVKESFDYRGWTYVSQEYDTRNLLLRIIKSFGGLGEETLERIESRSEEDLELYLRNFLQGKRYLVVIDDVWEKEAWESLKRAFPRNKKGSRVIMTTRIKAVAEGADERIYAHNLRFLSFEESWKLFQEKAYFRDYQGDDKYLGELGKEMVRKCDGLPLAIIVLAGILSRKRPNEWQKVRDHLWRHLKDDSIHISSVLTLSFDNLHHDLKLCFLYLSIFPEDHEIDVEDLIRLLVAEGFIQENEEIMEDIAERYVEELIDRSLIQVENRDKGRVQTCRVHDLLRDLVIKKAEELNFMHVHSGHQPPSLISTFRRIVIHNQINMDIHRQSLNQKTRSLLFFGDRTHIKGKPLHILLQIKLVRVLRLGDLPDWFLRNLPDAIGELIHLRYLRVLDGDSHNLNLAYLLKCICKCRHLQTLIVSGASFLRSMEKQIDLCVLKSLRHLIGRFGELLISTDASELQTLRSITSSAWCKINQQKMINLREWEIFDALMFRDRGVCLDMDSFSKLRNLRVLSLEVERFKFSSQDQLLPTFQNLIELKLSRLNQIMVLPEDLGRIFPNLESLELRTMNLKEDPMPALEKLPRLENLFLFAREYKKEKMVCSAKGFGRLRSLKLIISNIEELRIADDAMPGLMQWEHKGNVLKLMIPQRLQAFRQEIPLII